MYQSVLARGAVMPVSALLTAADVMTRDVVSVGPNTSLRWVATLLSKYQISGMPVVDDEDYPLGMITESDLLRWRDEPTDQQAWWLNMLADGFELSSDFLENVRADREKVRNFMCSPATTVSESALLRDVARVMMEKNIKRAVVIGEGQDQGRMVGIISRGDLIRSMTG